MAKQPKHKWYHQLIVAEVHRRGATLTGIAIKAGIASSSCRVAVVEPQLAGERALSKFLGVPPQELWPDRYDCDGNRLISRFKPSRVATRNKSKKGRAA